MPPTSIVRGPPVVPWLVYLVRAIPSAPDAHRPTCLGAPALPQPRMYKVPALVRASDYHLPQLVPLYFLGSPPYLLSVIWPLFLVKTIVLEQEM